MSSWECSWSSVLAMLRVHNDSHSLTGPLFVSVKLDPPSDLQSNVSSGRCVLTWGISFGLEPLITSLSYELAFKRQEEAWEVTCWEFPGVSLPGLARVTGENRGGSELDVCVCVSTDKPKLVCTYVYEGSMWVYLFVHACLYVNL